jgi:protein O-mannosyl-transferase
MKKKYTYPIIIFLIFASCVAFGRITGNDFINFDDNAYITANNHIKSGINSESIKWAFKSVVVNNWVPLAIISHILDWSLFGANASGHHVVSLLLHIGAVIFLFLFLYKTTNNIWSALFAVAFFALHPLRVESVAWASERKDVLSMFFGMASLYSYALYTENSKLPQYCLCLMLFVLSLMSKSMLLTLPFIFLLLDYWPLERWQKAITAPIENRSHMMGRIIWEKIPFILLMIFSGMITILVQYGTSQIYTPFFTRIFNTSIVYVTYLKNTFWPVDLALFYLSVDSFPPWQILVSCFILSGVTVVVIYAFKKMPFLFVGWCWYLGTLIPVIGLIPTNALTADHYTYLPSIGIAIMLAWGIPSLIKSEGTRKKILFPAGIGVTIILTVLTWRQCGYWKNSIELWNHAVKVTENNSLAYSNLASALVDAGRIEDALDNYNRAILIRPDVARFYRDRGEIYAKLGQYNRAIEDYNEAIRIRPDVAELYSDRGTTHGEFGQFQIAIEDFNKAISVNTNYVDAYFNRGTVYAKLGQYKRAVDDFNKTINMKPDYALAYHSRGVAYLLQGNNQYGCRDAQKVCALGDCQLLEFAKGKGYCR